MALVTPDFPDFSTPSRDIAVDTDLTPALGTISNASPYSGIDVSQVQSVLVNFRPPAGAGGDRFLMRAAWGPAFGVNTEEYLFFHDASAYAPLNKIISWRLPCKGSALTLTVISSNGNAFSCTVTGTTRRFPRNTVDLIGSVAAGVGSGTGRFLASLASVSIPAAGTSATIFVPPVTSQVLIHTNQNIAAMSLTVNALDTALLAVTVNRLTIIRGDSLANGGIAIPIQGTGLEISATNNDTAAHSTNINVWDAS